MSFSKQNHHYIPQYWLRGFRNVKGELYGKSLRGIKPVSTRTVMTRDWLYTVFDTYWNPSDALEYVLSGLESEDARLFQRLRVNGYQETESDRVHLCRVMALQAVRHPDVLRRGHRLAKRLASLLTQAHDLPQDMFKARVAELGIHESDADQWYLALRGHGKELLIDQATNVLALSPQAAVLPEQESLAATPIVEQMVRSMKLALLEAPSGECYVLGDTPLPQSNLKDGFSVPLSASLAVQVIPAKTNQTTLTRRAATEAEVRDINRTQTENALTIVVGPSAEVLARL